MAVCTLDGSTASLAALFANKGADGQISLREAILAANNTVGTDTIRFKIGTGAQTITLASVLPTITGAIVIDGTTQVGYQAIGTATPFLPIILDGNGFGGGVNGLLTLGAGSSGSTIQGLVIRDFNGRGIFVQSSSNVIRGNFIGQYTNSGTNAGAALRNTDVGIELNGGSLNTVGGALASQRNVIGGNLIGVGVVNATFNTVQGNYIGTDITGTVAIGNLTDGMTLVSGALSNTITGNIISASGLNGIDVGALGVNTSNFITSNLIGTDVTGTLNLGNASHGIAVGNGGTASSTSIGGVGLGNFANCWHHCLCHPGHLP